MGLKRNKRSNLHILLRITPRLVRNVVVVLFAEYSLRRNHCSPNVLTFGRERNRSPARFCDHCDFFRDTVCLIERRCSWQLVDRFQQHVLYPREPFNCSIAPQPAKSLTPPRASLFPAHERTESNAKCVQQSRGQNIIKSSSNCICFSTHFMQQQRGEGGLP